MMTQASLSFTKSQMKAIKEMAEESGMLRRDWIAKYAKKGVVDALALHTYSLAKLRKLRDQIDKKIQGLEELES